MKERKYAAYRVKDGVEVEVTGLIPETPDDLEELDRLNAAGLLDWGGSFAEQQAHEREVESRRREISPASTG
jgi:hypothetical protein